MKTPDVERTNSQNMAQGMNLNEENITNKTESKNKKSRSNRLFYPIHTLVY